MPDPDISPLQANFLHHHAVSIVNDDNPQTQLYNRDSQHVHLFMAEVVSVLKDITQLNPGSQDQITKFLTKQVASNAFVETDDPPTLQEPSRQARRKSYKACPPYRPAEDRVYCSITLLSLILKPSPDERSTA